MRCVQELLWMAVWYFKEINCGSFLIQNSMQMKEIQTPASTCKFGNVSNFLLIDRMGCGIPDLTWLERLLRGRFHTAEMHHNSKDRKTVWEKAPSNDNCWFRTNMVKEKIKDRVISKGRLTKGTNVQFMYRGKKYKGRKTVCTNGQPRKGTGRICCRKASREREGRSVYVGELAALGWDGWWDWFTEDIRTGSSIRDGHAKLSVKRNLTRC